MKELKESESRPRMVAISLYRGNLHRVPDVPRRWFMPSHKLSLKQFKILLTRRSKALSRHRATTLNPNPNSKLQNKSPKQNDSVPEVQLKAENVGLSEEVPSFGEVKNRKGSDGAGDCSVKPVDGCDLFPGSNLYVTVKSCEVGVDPGPHLQDGKAAELENPNSEVSNKGDVLNEKEKRKRDVEAKLQVLNEKKHNLVQVLKQILHVEEELKRRNNMPGTATRPSDPLQVDATTDNGLMIRQVEGAETDDLANRNIPSCNMLRTSSISPSSDSPLRRPGNIQNNVVSLPTRTNSGATVSPSQFAPTGHQGHTPNLPAVSVSGTNYIASSPSPAASGGTSVFRDALQLSPWN